MTSERNIYALPFGSRWLVYSPWSGLSALVNKAAVHALARCEEQGEGAEDPAIVHLWRGLHDKDSNPVSESLQQEKLVIIPTRDCNLRCVYCDFEPRGKGYEPLNPKLAFRLIDEFIDRCGLCRGEVLRIHFFGGEPLVAGDVVESVVHYARMICAKRGMFPWFEVTTNGHFHPEMIPFLGDYIDNLVVSLDGPAEIHDNQRRKRNGNGTYSTIARNLEGLAGHRSELNLRACITRQSVNRMIDIVDHFHSRFIPSGICFESLVANDRSRAAGLTPPDPELFALNFLAAEEHAETLGVRLVHGPSELVNPRRSSCPVGKNTWMLNPDGRVTACYLDAERWQERGLDFDLGRVSLNAGARVSEAKLHAISSQLADKPRCGKCFCRFTCAGGCHVDQTPPGCSYDYDERCRVVRIVTAGRLLRRLGSSMSDLQRDGEGPESVWTALADHLDDRLTSRLSGPEGERC